MDVADVGLARLARQGWLPLKQYTIGQIAAGIREGAQSLIRVKLNFNPFQPGRPIFHLLVCRIQLYRGFRRTLNQATVTETETESGWQVGLRVAGDRCNAQLSRCMVRGLDRVRWSGPQDALSD